MKDRLAAIAVDLGDGRSSALMVKLWPTCWSSSAAGSVAAFPGSAPVDAADTGLCNTIANTTASVANVTMFRALRLIERSSASSLSIGARSRHQPAGVCVELNAGVSPVCPHADPKRTGSNPPQADLH